MTKPAVNRAEEFNVGPLYKVCKLAVQTALFPLASAHIGAYGVVASAIYKPNGEYVAIKKIQPFDHPLFASRTLREIKLMRHFKHENIVSILDIIKPESFETFTHVYLVEELMQADLHIVVRKQDLSDDHVQYFVYQIFRGLKALHSAGVLHRDLKPSNLLLNSNCDLKICDFGLARSVAQVVDENGNGQPGFMTEYVATRWYRAPEIMLTFKQYTLAIDVWSVGCILAEMLGGQPLFPGRDYHDQLNKIFKVIGSPGPNDLYSINSSRSRDYIKSLGTIRAQRFEDLYPKANPEALDLLAKCLTFNPVERITAEQALAHPYLGPYHDPEDEPTAEVINPAVLLLDQYDTSNDRMTIAKWKELCYEEVMKDKSVKA